MAIKVKKYKEINQDFNNPEAIIEAVKIFKEKKSSDEEKDAIMITFLNNMKGIIYNNAKRFRSGNVEFDDLIQIGELTVLEELKNYNPQFGGCYSSPSTFFVPRIQQAMLTATIPPQMTKHYRKILNDVFDKAEELDIHISLSEKMDPLTLEKLSKATGNTKMAILQAFELDGVSFTSYDGLENQPDDEFHGTPESIAERQETTNLLLKVISEVLTDFERRTYIDYVVKQVKPTKIAEFVNKNPELYGLAPGTKVNSNKVLNAIHHAQYKLRNSELKKSGTANKTLNTQKKVDEEALIREAEDLAFSIEGIDFSDETSEKCLSNLKKKEEPAFLTFNM